MVVIVSGGMDSITLLSWLHKKGHQLKVLSFDYGQRHRKELTYARSLCKSLKINHRTIKLNSLTQLLNRSALTGNIKVPYGHYAAPSMKKTVVPNRNMIMLSIAIGYAENLKYHCVAIANHAGDHAIYPDCRPEFIKALNHTSQLATYQKIRLYAPFTHLTKGQIALIGLRLKLNYSKNSWSCYEGGKMPCQKCGTCVERKEALHYAYQHFNTA